MTDQKALLPKVSILIPVYKREAIIGECIQSALDQSFTDLEVVVVDNASDDGTWQICQQFAAKDHRVRAFRNDTNIGPVRNWLACLAQARGEYTKILWSDDLIHPEFLDKLLPFLEQPDVGFVYSATDIFTSNRFESIAQYFRNAKTGVYDTAFYINGALLGGDFPGSPGCAIFRTADVRKNLLLQVPNSVNSDFSMHAIGNDLLLFLLTAVEYPKFALVNEPLAYFRAHATSITTSAAKGKIPLHYDLAKGFFAENHVKDESFIKKLNAEFLIHLYLYQGSQFGIRSLSDFYPAKISARVDYFYFAQRLLRVVRKRIMSILTVFKSK
ncbi:putative glycosyltransferase EpsE [mine drainage metagenome]|uniref:Putative glycosyltransferase EpsE n=1 Tax=mine drainage metagenome TaxID=410659 RepID=A0A1J5RME4_9ZZZZ